MKRYLAVLDREHLENSLFLTAFAKALAAHGNRKGIIIHGDSEYTERIIQTGVMRADARQRAVKDLNRRLVGLLADQGVPAIGINGYQKKLIRKTDQGLQLDKKQLNNLPETPCILLSSLVDDQGQIHYTETGDLALALFSQLDDYHIVSFSKREEDDILVSSGNEELEWSEVKESPIFDRLPEEMQDLKKELILTTASDFTNWPDLKAKTVLT